MPSGYCSRTPYWHRTRRIITAAAGSVDFIRICVRFFGTHQQRTTRLNRPSAVSAQMRTMRIHWRCVCSVPPLVRKSNLFVVFLNLRKCHIINEDGIRYQTDLHTGCLTDPYTVPSIHLSCPHSSSGGCKLGTSSCHGWRVFWTGHSIKCVWQRWIKYATHMLMSCT